MVKNYTDFANLLFQNRNHIFEGPDFWDLDFQGTTVRKQASRQVVTIWIGKKLIFLQ